MPILLLILMLVPLMLSATLYCYTFQLTIGKLPS